jgi:hypothetical protein
LAGLATAVVAATAAVVAREVCRNERRLDDSGGTIIRVAPRKEWRVSLAADNEGGNIDTMISDRLLCNRRRYAAVYFNAWSVRT